MDEHMRGIGQMARESGLSVSALRFYDSAGILVPARVDPQSGYRWYGDEQLRDARLVARLRRVGMPLADVARVLAHSGEPALAEEVLAAHLRRLTDGLADARRELAAASVLIRAAHQETVMTASATLDAHALFAALRAVRYAVSSDPELPGLTGVLLELRSAAVHLAATDRHRLAVSEAPATDVYGGPLDVIAPVALIDDVLAHLAETPRGSSVDLAVDGTTITLAGRTAEAVAGDFPDYRRLVREGSVQTLAVDAADLRTRLGAVPTSEVAMLTLGADGGYTFDDAEGLVSMALNREFLLQALDAHATGQLVLGLDGPVTPLAIREPARTGTFSLIMPIRLDQPA